MLLLVYIKMEFYCTRMGVPLGLLAQRWARHGTLSTMQPTARRLFSSEAAGRGQSQKRTAIVTGSSRGMYDMTFSMLYHVSDTLMLIRILMVKPLFGALLTMVML